MQPKCGQKRKGRRFQSCELAYIWMRDRTKELKGEPLEGSECPAPRCRYPGRLSRLLFLLTVIPTEAEGSWLDLSTGTVAGNIPQLLRSSFAFFVRRLHPGCFYRGIPDGFVLFAPFSELEIQRELNLAGTDSLNRVPKSRHRCQV
jgi:hypothetical protein